MAEAKRSFIRDCQFCHAKGDDPETIMFTMECDVVDEFAYGYSIRCVGCGAALHDEYKDEVLRVWNGEPKKDDEE